MLYLKLGIQYRHLVLKTLYSFVAIVVSYLTEDRHLMLSLSHCQYYICRYRSLMLKREASSHLAFWNSSSLLAHILAQRWARSLARSLALVLARVPVGVLA